MADPSDAIWMREAIRLSRKGFPAPNPHVGCVLVRGGQIVGRGFHPFAGGPHAEIVALQAAGDQARGATAYVTLEPCNHTGRTGPCSEALIQAGVSRVVMAVPDPNPKAQGGAERLRAEGIEVAQGVLADSARSTNEVWLSAQAMGRPFVCVKAAMGLDGRIALPTGESKWITTPEARRAGRRLRAEMGAVLVGRGTVTADDPRLTARLRGAVNPPVRVVLDPQARLSGRERLFGEPGEVIWVVAGEPVHPAQLAVPRSEAGLDLSALLAELWKKGLTSVLVEGGATTIGGFLRAGLVDRLDLFIGAKVLGDGPGWVQGLDLSGLEAAPEFAIQRVHRLGSDLRLTAVPR